MYLPRSSPKQPLKKRDIDKGRVLWSGLHSPPRAEHEGTKFQFGLGFTCEHHIHMQGLELGSKGE